MRILEIAPPYQPLLNDGYGGIERVVASRSAALARRGHEVTLLAPGTRAPPGVRLLPLRTVGSPVRTAHATAVHWAITSRSVRYLGPFVDPLPQLDRAFDVVLNDALRYEPWTGLFFLVTLRQAHTIHMLHADFALATRLRRFLDPPFAGLRLGMLNRGQLEIVRRLGYEAEYTPNGVEVPPVTEVVDQPDPRLIFVGRLDRFKAPHLAIEIARRIGRPIDLVGPVRDQPYFDAEVRPILGDGARYLGELPRQELTSRLRHAEALVFTSQFEDAMPAVLQEAISFGVPVLGFTSSRTAGFRDVVVPGENGVVLPDLAAAPTAFRECRALDRRAVHLRAVAQWSWDAVVERHFEPLVQRLGGAHGPLPGDAGTGERPAVPSP